ncbi:unnamed protein product [Microthlaspi erraticum]|uniref:Uncharacterized protein n=1 Tax=Microthlaspi erraticum TaxID=1685480 RepID=A0A6D2LDA0_9BRAS|nr:unnamed protein product [Microthlaspi erraticum]
MISVPLGDDEARTSPVQIHLYSPSPPPSLFNAFKIEEQRKQWTANLVYAIVRDGEIGAGKACYSKSYLRFRIFHAVRSPMNFRVGDYLQREDVSEF